MRYLFDNLIRVKIGKGVKVFWSNGFKVKFVIKFKDEMKGGIKE